MIACVLLLVTQSVSISGRVTFPSSSSQLGVQYDSISTTCIIDRSAGIWAGVALDAQMSRFSATLSGLRGGLGAADAQFPERVGGEIAAVVRFQPQSAFAFEVRHHARVFSSAAGRLSWGIWGVGGRGFLDLGSPFVRATGGLTYMPAVTVTHGPRPLYGIAADFALTVTPRQSPLVFMTGYRIEKFIFSFADQRAEQFETLTLSLGLRMERRDGRWKLGGRGER